MKGKVNETQVKQMRAITAGGKRSEGGGVKQDKTEGANHNKKP